MRLVERHIITKNNEEWKKIDKLCFLSKNLYNQALYEIKKEYEKSRHFLRYGEMEKLLKNKEIQYNDFYKLPPNSSQQILMILDKNLKSYFSLLRKWKSDKKSLSGCPMFPKYKHKIKGRNVIVFTSDNQVKLRNGYIKFPKKTNLKLVKTKINNLKQVRIIPQKSCYILEIVYEKKEKQNELNSKKYIGIDLGVNNLTSIISNVPGLKPFNINGRILKSINQFYNKEKSIIQSQLIKNHNKYASNRLNKLELKRNNIISNYLHNTSKYIINYCIANKIGNIIIGKNVNWKKNINIGKKNNQNFVQIPFNTLIKQIEYKSKLNGIEMKLVEESYTSKIDHLSLEKMDTHDAYLGKRIKRGLFSSSSGITLNADTNGSIGILRKEIGDSFITKINRGDVVSPVKVNPLLTTNTENYISVGG